MIGFHGFLSRFPSGGTYFTMFVCKLKCLDKTQSLVDITTNREIIDRHLPQDTLVINDEKATERNTVVLFQDVVSLMKNT